MMRSKEKRILDKLHSLADKKEPYNTRELNFVKKHNNKSRYQILYGFYRGQSKRPIGYVIDESCKSPRRSMFFNSFEVFLRRPPNEIEWHEICQNYRCSNRRFTIHWYSSIKALEVDDLKYEISTPETFIEECLKRGFKNGHQSKLQF